jgi:hypothetical protein
LDEVESQMDTEIVRKMAAAAAYLKNLSYLGQLKLELLIVSLELVKKSTTGL